MPSDLGTPVNTALFIYILYSVQRIVFPSVTKRPLLPSSEVANTRTGIPHEFKAGYSWMPKSHPPTVLFKVYTPKSLEPLNGNEKDGRILLAINRIVFDVTSGRNFYGPSKLVSLRQRALDAYVVMQMECTVTLRGGMRREAWRSRVLMWVSVHVVPYQVLKWAYRHVCRDADACGPTVG